jgi:hypothetical protein
MILPQTQKPWFDSTILKTEVPQGASFLEFSQYFLNLIAQFMKSLELQRLRIKNSHTKEKRGIQSCSVARTVRDGRISDFISNSNSDSHSLSLIKKLTPLISLHWERISILLNFRPSHFLKMIVGLIDHSIDELFDP